MLNKTEDDTYLDLYTKLFDDGDDIEAYQNPYALSIAFASDVDIATFNIGSSSLSSPYERLNGMVNSLTGDSSDSADIFTPVSNVESSLVNLSTAATTDGQTKYSQTVSGSLSTLTYTFTAQDSRRIYMNLPSTYAGEVGLTVNGVSKGTYFGTDTNHSMDLGSFSGGEDVTVVLTYKEKPFYIKTDTNYFWYFNTDQFKTAFSDLGENQFTITDYTEDSFEGFITTTEDKRTVFTSIPYDEGWVVTVDGEKVDTYEVCNALIAFDTSAGTHQVTIKYRPKVLTYAILLSLTGCVLLVVVIIYDKKRTRLYFPKKITAGPKKNKKMIRK